MQVCLHQLLHEIDVSEPFEAGRLEDVEDGDDVFVAKVPEEFDLAESAKTEHGVVERGDAFDGNFPLGGLMDGRAGWGQRVNRHGEDWD